MVFTNNSGSRKNFAKDPGVIKFMGKYILYHSIYEKNDNKEKLGIGIAISYDLDNWKVIGSIPFSGECSKKGAGAPAAIVLKDKVHLFYQSYGSWKNDAICHAISTDGINFIENKTNPVFRPTSNWCIGRAIDADVCVFNNKLFLYFATRDFNMKIQKLGVAYAPVNSDYLASDFIQAVPQSILVPEFKWEGECIEAPATIVYNNMIYMFYGGHYNCMPQQIGCAVSNDGIFFKKIFTEPFLTAGKAGTWNSDESGHPYIFKDDDGQAYLFYQGTNNKGKEWYINKTKIYWDNKGIPYLK